jgi:hypothetical protein
MSSSVTSRVEWQKRVAALVPSLSPSQAKVLGLISYGIVLFDGCGMTLLSNGLGKVEQVPASRLRQRLREFYYEAEAKRGKKRREVDVQTCFGDLLAGILRDWHGEKRLALALDASTLGERFTVLNLSVLYRGCALPVAWVIIRAKQKGSWRPYWEGLLASVATVVPPDWKVIVAADQGLYADWLWTAIQDQGWHPLLRISLQMGFRAEGEVSFAAVGKQVQRRGRGWKGKGEWSEKGARMQGTLLVRWEKGYEEAMAVVTDLPEEEVEMAWYLMRFWIEDEYKDHKRGGWGWQHTKMEDPKRAERLWLAMAVAMQMAVLVGGLEESQEEEQRSGKRRKAVQPRRVGRPAKPLHKPRGREQSCLVRGQQRIQAAVMRAEALPQGYVVSEPWPKRTYRPSRRTSKQGGKNKKREANRSYKQRRRARGDETDQKKDRERVQEQRKRQRQAQRANKANRKAERQKEQEAERLRTQQEQAARRIQRREERQTQKQEEQAHKREARIRTREEREQVREERRLWHEDIQRERVARQLRQADRADRRSSLDLGSLSASSKKIPLQQALAEPLEPP